MVYTASNLGTSFTWPNLKDKIRDMDIRYFCLMLNGVTVSSNWKSSQEHLPIFLWQYPQCPYFAANSLCKKTSSQRLVLLRTLQDQYFFCFLFLKMPGFESTDCNACQLFSRKLFPDFYEICESVFNGSVALLV